ncbi:HAD family hydrolase [Myceligenerans pegani]|uniref:Haloacid dehalogenase-like hydrolase n=1 Tax=Myceligenerans pegani TaxID=2776917 RepID=A0ABR9N013_9MICO|nr:HAD hydrolase-like protein [Myceligenerans sp. TRM 65318]MBE1876977.1 haloacid dehalogenase-like hydrolase [Myceligenerans sp. TRM 65318]MBE3019248.1 haloacid dehalogenase-like hydrolase [Myceligenerans sp. TRM 65318]
MSSTARGEHGTILLLWDIDRTLLYVGEVDRTAYREAFEKVVGRPASRFPARGTGMTMPRAVRGLLLDNGVSEDDAERLLPRMLTMVPECLAAHEDDVRRDGVLMPGARAAVTAVAADGRFVPAVVTGNLEPNARLKLRVFELDRYIDPDVGAYASDDEHRPALVAIAQKRAGERYGERFTRENTVIVGDSLEDVRTGVEGGARVVGVAAGRTSAAALRDAGADVVLPDLTDVERLLTAADPHRS